MRHHLFNAACLHQVPDETAVTANDKFDLHEQHQLPYIPGTVSSKESPGKR